MQTISGWSKKKVRGVNLKRRHGVMPSLNSISTRRRRRRKVWNPAPRSPSPAPNPCLWRRGREVETILKVGHHCWLTLHCSTPPPWNGSPIRDMFVEYTEDWMLAFRWFSAIPLLKEISAHSKSMFVKASLRGGDYIKGRRLVLSSEPGP